MRMPISSYLYPTTLFWRIARSAAFFAPKGRGCHIMDWTLIARKLMNACTVMDAQMLPLRS